MLQGSLYFTLRTFCIKHDARVAGMRTYILEWMLIMTRILITNCDKQIARWFELLIVVVGIGTHPRRAR